MQLRQMETVVAIAHEGTLTAAAASLYKTQGAVSHDLKSLEAELGTKLIDRSGQRATLTPAGETFLPHAYELLRRAADIEQEMREIGRGEAGLVRVGVLPSLSLELGAHVGRFVAERARIHFGVYSEMHRALGDWMQRGEIDLMVTDEIPGDSEHLDVTKLTSEPLVIVVRADDALANDEVISAERVADRPYVGFDRNLGRVSGAEQFFAPLGRYPEPIVRANDFRLMLELVRLGIGFAFVPRTTVRADDDLVMIPSDPPISRDLIVALAANRRPPRAVEIFRDFIAEQWANEAGEA